MSESTHTIIESVHEGTITADDAIRVLMPAYTADSEFIADLASVVQYMTDHMAEHGSFPPEFVDFVLCEGDDDYEEGCHRLMVWDDHIEDHRHLEPAKDCYWFRMELGPEPHKLDVSIQT